jgi:hypothetical protein
MLVTPGLVPSGCCGSPSTKKHPDLVSSHVGVIALQVVEVVESSQDVEVTGSSSDGRSPGPSLAVVCISRIKMVCTSLGSMRDGSSGGCHAASSLTGMKEMCRSCVWSLESIVLMSVVPSLSYG